MHFPNPILTSGPSLFCFLQLVVLGGDTLGFVPPVVGELELLLMLIVLKGLPWRK